MTPLPLGNMLCPLEEVHWVCEDNQLPSCTCFDEWFTDWLGQLGQTNVWWYISPGIRTVVYGALYAWPELLLAVYTVSPILLFTSV